ncbi:bifunctional proline dehydrogenase/L-glutamate gamma-semialdehyde dehydrogenase PutA [Chitinilyticum piscinae]|uniref:Bifunctional protein PutA n=1 Tax=Chitinilyticum piscinae TaxID=2866724 RepID=A0A8J7G176_9NEIS|nr:bifunctional proline dehydrogenase/L-glutamate gamma-semialdehyde dehydrogenase PutA [Chitinilyticum piscinae]MBE9610100.1 bifunctional proline dehydrogenase/L-glutamate gamma-semialdehyde dehydrogenase PutA [Chitinilyticum piscinae]
MPSHSKLADLERYLQQDEATLVRYLQQNLPTHSPESIEERRILGNTLTSELGKARRHAGGIDALLAEFPLSSPEGRALLELTEALPRIPDQHTQDLLIREKLQQSNWRGRKGSNSPWLVRLASWALQHARDWSASSAGETLVRPALKLAIEQLGEQFVIAEDIHTALLRRKNDFLYSFDMLGEAALGYADADRYFASYRDAIAAVGTAANGSGARMGPGISVKLSALHPRYHPLQRDEVFAELLPRLLELATQARDADIGLTIDAEESERLLLSLELFEKLALSPALQHWDGLGLAVQAYQTRAPGVIDWVIQLAHRRGTPLMLRLVKGAYWDSEIKRAQQLALPGYPVFTRKAHTDLCYEFCALRLLQAQDWIYPQFATHNAHTIAMIRQHADPLQDYEFQALFGMGETLYRLLPQHDIPVPCRLYAPVGEQASLLPYLVRRLLENGANTSFLHQLHQSEADEPTGTSLPAPDRLFAGRRTAAMLDLNRPQQLAALLDACEHDAPHHLSAAPLLAQGYPEGYKSETAFNPADEADTLGSITISSAQDLGQALALAATPPNTRQAAETASWLEKTADLLVEQQARLIQLLIREAGKTLANALAEWREAIDFCRYYALQARGNWPDAPLCPLGTLVVISPWNFPLAILTGQIAAALATGNRVLAKPAPQTPLIATTLVHLLHQAGVPREQLQLLPGDGETGAALCSDPRIAGVLFTGSLATAQAIRRTLAASPARRLLIAETGGVNALFVDSSAHLDQVVAQVMESAFDSAGQRCSALRLLCVQDDVADLLWERLCAALQTLVLGDPWRLDCDVGPVIDAAARQRLEGCISTLLSRSLRSCQLAVPLDCATGYFVPPTLLEINEADLPASEIFGPLLCLLRYRRDDRPRLLGRLRLSGYGLTMGIATRLASEADAIIATSHIGNYYVNRNQIGAIVESQPFGGTGRSGTGPKAGGPWLLWQLVQDGSPPMPQARWHAPQGLQVLLDLELDFTEREQLGALFARYPALGADEALPDRPGCTGERNRYGHRPAGKLFCTASNTTELLHQIGAALATGNQPLVSDCEQHRRWQQHLPALLLTADAHPEHLGAVLASTSDYTAREHQWAHTARDLVPVIAPGNDGCYPWHRLRHEYCITINTAAIGGNTELLGQSAGQMPD